MDDLKQIKKEYGEKLAHLCRDLFPTVLETPGVLYNALKKTFYPTKFLYDDLYNDSLKDIFKEAVSCALPNQQRIEQEEVIKSAKELLDEAGYTLYECKTEADIQSFRKYYKRQDDTVLPEYKDGEEPIPYNGEELCTFNGYRLERCHVFFAVKKNVDEIKREDFKGKEERDDEYGTSVISIQFSKGPNNVLSIKNRYNHTVSNPDATFSNNLDNIIKGLSQAFENDYGFNIQENKIKEIIPGYVIASDGKYYKYNIEEHNVYFCPDNIIIDHHDAVYHYDKSEYIIFDTFILDLKAKKIKQYNISFDDSFPRYFPFIQDIKVEVDKKTKHKKITIDKEVTIILSPTNEMIYYRNPIVEELASDYLSSNKKLIGISLPKVTKIKDGFLEHNKDLKYLSIPNCEYIGEDVLVHNNKLERLHLPKVKSLRDNFLTNNKLLKELSLPSCTVIGDDCFSSNTQLEKLDLPKLEFVGSSFFEANEKISKLNLPNCKIIGTSFLNKNLGLEEIYLPKADTIEYEFLEYNRKIKKIDLPKCVRIDSSALSSTTKVEEVNMPKVEHIGNKFLMNAKRLKTLSLPKVIEVGYDFLTGAVSLESIDLPRCWYIGKCFLVENKILNSINIPNCISISDNFMPNNQGLQSINLPMVLKIGKCFLSDNKGLKQINIPRCDTIGDRFLCENEALETEILELPSTKFIGDLVLSSNNRIKIARLPNCLRINHAFLYSNEVLEELDAPNLTIVEKDTLCCNKSLKNLNVPKLIQFGSCDWNDDVSFYSQLPAHPLAKQKRKEGAKPWMI